MCKCLLSEWVSRVLRFAPRAIKLFTIHCSLFAISGCGLFWDDPYVTVTVTPLNWCEIHYYNATRDPVRRVVRGREERHVAARVGQLCEVHGRRDLGRLPRPAVQR